MHQKNVAASILPYQAKCCFVHIPSVRKANLVLFSLVGSCLKLREIQRHSTNVASPLPSLPAEYQERPKGRAAALSPASRVGKLRHSTLQVWQSMVGLSELHLQLRSMLLACSKCFSDFPMLVAAPGRTHLINPPLSPSSSYTAPPPKP